MESKMTLIGGLLLVVFICLPATFGEPGPGIAAPSANSPFNIIEKGDTNNNNNTAEKQAADAAGIAAPSSSSPTIAKEDANNNNTAEKEAANVPRIVDPSASSPTIEKEYANNNTAEKQAADAANSSSAVDPLTQQWINLTSSLAGMKPNETQRLLRAIMDSLADNLATNNNNSNTNDGGSDVWLDQPLPQEILFVVTDENGGDNSTDNSTNKEARSLVNTENVAVLYNAKRYCGFSPNVARTLPIPLPQGVFRASPGQYPWTAAVLGSDGSFLCAGTLISESIVLTTGSCILKYRKSNQPIKVVLGAYSLPADLNRDIFPQLELYAKSAVIHPSFNADAASSDIRHNIGLLRLTANVDFDLYPWIFPICIIGPSLEQYGGTSSCRTLGWPDLPETNLRTHHGTKSALVSIDSKVSKSGCASSASSCVSGSVCNANEGSEVICLANNSQRYYQWGLVAAEPNCDRGSTTTLSTVSIIENYDFIIKYLWTPNPNTN